MNDWIDMIGVIGGIIYNLALIGAMVFLMVHFNHWWPIFILLGVASVKYTNDKKALEDKES